MNESSQACCEHYQSGGWINTLSCKAQLLFSCFTACLSSCLSTCLPDYLPTYRAPFVQIKGASMGARWNIIHFHKNPFWKGNVLSSFALSHCLPPLLTIQPLPITLSDRLASSLPVYLNSQLPLWVCAFLHSLDTCLLCMFLTSLSAVYLSRLSQNGK